MLNRTIRKPAGKVFPAREGGFFAAGIEMMRKFFSVKRNAVGYTWLLFAFILPATAYAQAVVVQPAASIGARFFVALVTGLVLAVAFQMLLTNLSVASGLSILSGATSGKGGSPGKGSSAGSSSEGLGGTVRKISSGFGLWALITASISLFFASWLAVRLALTTSYAIGATLGLVIWGVFYILTLSVESSALASLVGALGGVVRQSLRSASGTLGSMFGRSPESKARDTVRAVREEFFGSRTDFRNQLSSYLRQVQPRPPSAEQTAREIARMLSDTEIRFVTTQEGKETIVSFLEKNLGAEKAKSVAQGLQGAVAAAQQEAGTKKDVVSKAADTAMRMTGASEKEAQSYREKVENYLRSTKKEQLNPDAIKREVEELIHSPKAGMEALKSRISRIDKSTVTALLAQRKDISSDDARRLVDKVDQVLQTIRGSVESKTAGVQAKVGDIQGGIQGKIKDYLDSLHRPDLSYEGIRSDLQTLMHDPKAGADALIRRLKSIDRDDIKAVLASRKDISDEQAEQIIDQVEGARDEVVHRAQQMEAEVEHRVEQVKAEALHQAEEARKTAANAAWWVLASAVVSGVAAALGGMAGVVPLPI